MPGAIPDAINGAAFSGAPTPAGLSDEEKHSYDQLVFFYKHVSYAFLMGTRPQTLTGLTDSPIALATYMLDHDGASLEMIARSFDGQDEGLLHHPALRGLSPRLAAFFSSALAVDSAARPPTAAEFSARLQEALR